MNDTIQTHEAKDEAAPLLPGTEARFHRFRMGSIDCVSLSDGAIRVPLGPPEPGKPMQYRLVPLACLLLTLPATGKVVLIDSGFGFNPALLGKPLLSDGRLAESLTLAGISPDSIDDVLLSHLDPDHADGLFADDGRRTFPRATYHAAAEDLAFWGKEAVDLSDSPCPEPLKRDRLRASARLLRLAAGTIRTFRTGEEVLPGIRSMALPGHTPGQVGFLIDGGSESLLYTADAVTNAVISVETPHVYNPLDLYPEQGVQTRRMLLRTLSEKEWLNFSPHFPFPAFGRIKQVEEGFVWRAKS